MVGRTTEGEFTPLSKPKSTSWTFPTLIKRDASRKNIRKGGKEARRKHLGNTKKPPPRIFLIKTGLPQRRA